ncbi:MAG: hypothetical protein CMI60_00860 [Parvibaculum sp.]|nr:hypothetical protein [Parvibaculum sp.]
MAIRKHAMTRTGAIVSITREQIKKIREQGLNENSKYVKGDMGVNSTFIDRYKSVPDKDIQDLYKQEFGIELVIVK